MKKLNSKSIAIAVVILLSLSAIIAISNNTAKANITPYRGEVYPTWTYVSVAPTTEGVGQTATLLCWCNFLPPTAIGQYGDRWSFTFNIIKPDGTNDTIGPLESDPVGDGFTTYTPTVPGTYTIQAIMAQHVIDGGASRGLISPGGIGFWPSGSPLALSYGPTGPVYLDPRGDVFQSSVSEPQTMTVQSTAISSYTETPLPSDYWTRPVYDVNRAWGQTIMGEWFNAAELNQFGNGGRYNPYTTGPASAHILWTSPYWDGGTAGGVAGLGQGGNAVSYYSGQSYEGYGSQPYMILNGKAYVSVQTDPREGFYELDLATGKQVYYANSTGSVTGAGGPFAGSGSRPGGIPAFGQILDMETPNQHGTLGYYWVTSTNASGKWDLYDDFSNNYICSIGNIPTWATGAGGIFAATTTATSYGNDGSILKYQITSQNGKLFLQCWNTTQAILAPSMLSDFGYIPVTGQSAPTSVTGSGSNTYWMWRPQMNNIYDGSLGYSMNISIPNTIAYSVPGLFGASGDIQQIIPDKEIIGIYPGSNNGTVSVPGQVWALSLKAGSEGQVLYQYNFTVPVGLGDAAAQSQQFFAHDTAFGGMDANASIFWYQNSMLRQWYVLSLTDGHALWTSSEQPQFEFEGMGTVVVYNNQFIDTGGYGGVITSWNAQTGAFLWNWSAPIVGQGETPYQNTPTYFGALSGDGIMYIYSNEHSVNNPIRRDAMIWAINANTGKEIWQETCWPSGAPILGDGNLLVLDDHDNQIYNYGKGPSSTTVSAPLSGVTQGQGFMIQGTVMDTSPGTTQNKIALRFPDGVPAVSDESETAWMAYIYQQAALPTNATGVEVNIDAIDPNGNFVTLGTTHSDSTGLYAFAITPSMLSAGLGAYTVIATFHGSNSNYPSYSESSFYVNAGPSATNAPTPTPSSAADMYFVPAIAGLFILIIIVLIVVVLLMVRKRP
jgi:hypothetical protein